MAIVAELGTNLNTGAIITELTLPNAANYIVQSVTENGREVDFEDVFDSDGARVTRLIFNRNPSVTVNVVCKNGAAPATDFPVGTMIATDWFVESASVEKTKGAHTVSLTLNKIFTNV